MEKTVRVVVIDDNEVVLSSVKEYFLNDDSINVKTFSDGKEGLSYLLSYPNDYDLIVLDILLPNIDGIKILEELKENNIKKKIIVLSSFKDDWSIKKIQTLNVDYYMLKPISEEILADRIMDLVDERLERKVISNNSVEVKVSELLHNLGIPSHIRGYKYIREGVMILYTSNNLVTMVTKDIYPEIAERFETTSSRVERAIRHAIEISWIRGDLKLMDELFGNSIDVERSKPTNSEFLTTIADRFKIKNKELVG